MRNQTIIEPEADDADIDYGLGAQAHEQMMGDGTLVKYGADGIIEVDFDPQPEPAADVDEGDFKANLAEVLDDDELAKIAEDLLESIEQDKNSRSDWEKRLAQGMMLMGVTDDNDKRPFPGASTTIHPVLGEAVTQFQSRAITELFPSAGPVKGLTVGEANDDHEARRDRGEDYMNYQYTVEMPEAFWEMDQLLFRLPLEGSAFKKTWIDRAKKRTCQGFVPAEDLIVPYTAKDLYDAPRHTHILRYYANDMRRLMKAGFYRQIELDDPQDDAERDDIEEEVDSAEGRQPTDLRTDRRHEVYECNTEYAIEGLGDEEDDVHPPYLISIEVESRKVLSIYRNWKEGDEDRKKRVHFTHYKYLPGFGFYGFGLIHMIGGLSKAATGALRALLDSAQLANMRGGFKSKDAKMPAGDQAFAPGEWKDVEMTADDIKKAFMPFDYKEPSNVLFSLLGFLVESAQRFASTTEAMVGDADNKGPVGTTIALIEQGSKVFSAIHKRLHKSQGEEFKHLSELNYEILPPDQPYPYKVSGDERVVAREDFDGRVDWIPVSDPNIFSSTQRIAQGQALLDLADKDPELYNKREVHVHMLEALRFDDIERFLPDTTKVERMDPISENIAMMNGRPTRAYLDQDHEAHIITHEAWFNSMDKRAQNILQGVHMAHIAEHMSWAYKARMERMAGAQMPYTPDIHAETGQPMIPRVPIEMENQITAKAAQVSQMLEQQQQDQGPPPDPRMIEAEAKIKRDDEIAAKEQQRKDAELDMKAKAVAEEVARKRDELNKKLGIEMHRSQSMIDLDREKANAEIGIKQSVANAEIQIKREAGKAQSRIDREMTMREQNRKDRDANTARDDNAEPVSDDAS